MDIVTSGPKLDQMWHTPGSERVKKKSILVSTNECNIFNTSIGDNVK